MHKLAPALMLIAAGLIVTSVPAVAPILPAAAFSNFSAVGITGSNNGIVFVGDAGGGMGGGMMGGGMMGGGMMGGGMMNGGMMGGGMMNGGMMGGGMNTGDMGGRATGVPGGIIGYSDPPAYGGATGSAGGGQSYGSNGTSVGGARPAKIYHCVTRNGRCAVDSSLGPLRSGASCGCLLSGPGKIQ
jgi:hypothetical protein